MHPMAFAASPALVPRRGSRATRAHCPSRRSVIVRACASPPPASPPGPATEGAAAAEEKTAAVAGKKASEVEASALAAAAATMILRRAAEAALAGTRRSRPPAATVGSALLELEKEQRRNGARTDVAALAGQWQLAFAGKVGMKAGLLDRPRYFPVRARQTFIPDGDKSEGGAELGEFDNGIFVAGCSLRFRGPYRWAPRMNRLEFTFTKCSIKLGPLGPLVFNDIDKAGSTLENRTAKTLPFFTFFLARNGIAAARGRGGGLALYSRVAPGDEL